MKSSTQEDYNKIAAKNVANIMTATVDLQLPELEDICKSALSIGGYSQVLAKHESSKTNVKPKEKKVMDLLPSVSTLSPNQKKNQEIRFGLDEEPASLFQRQSWAIKNTFLGAASHIGVVNPNAESKDYEDFINLDLIKAPISDICIIQRGEPVPDGFLRLTRTPSHKRSNLNAGSGGNHIYLCIKKDLTGEEAPVTAVTVIFPDNNEFLPPGFLVVRKGKHACNLNTGTSAERIFLCYKKDKSGNPITDLQIIYPGKNEECPKGYNIIEKSVTGLPANLNSGSGGGRIFLCFKQSYTRLECLRNNEGPIIPLEASSPGKTRNKSLTKQTTMLKISDNNNNNNNNNNIQHTTMAMRQEPDKSSLASPKSSSDNLPDEYDDGSSVFDSEKMSEIHEDIENEDSGHVDLDADDLSSGVDRKKQVVVDVTGQLVPAFQRRALHALLVALYTRKGTIAQQALSAIHYLLKETNFYENDLKGLPLPGTVTMLDMTIEAVCDMFDTCSVPEHETVLQFIRLFTKHSSGKLSGFVMQRLFRTLSFLCNYHSTRASWFVTGAPMPCSDDGHELLPFRIFKELIWSVVVQVETVDVAHHLPDVLIDDTNYTGKSESFVICHNIALTVVEEIIDSVEVSRISEAAHLAISKQSSSTSSSLFWVQIGALSRKLFTEHSLRTAFIALCAICKLAWHSMRVNDNGEPFTRDLGSKLLSLELINEFCAYSGEKLRLSKVMGYQIRRLVVPCLLNNLPYSLGDHRVFSKILGTISSIWKFWRVHVRIEFANLTEKLIIKILGASMMKIRPIYQMIVLREVVTWFDQPHLLVEMFVNFDMDRKFVSHWNVFSHLVRTICTIARRTSLQTGAWDWRPNDKEDTKYNTPNVTVREVHVQALEEVGRIAKTLMDATGHAHLLLQDSVFRSRTLEAGLGWEEDLETLGSGAEELGSESLDLSNSGKRLQGVKFRRAVHQQAEDMLQKAIKIYQEKGSLKKAVQFLVKNDFMPDTPQEIASFLRVYKNSFDPSAIGDFLGEGGTNPREEEYWSQIRFRYTRAVSFVEMELETALRLYLTGCGFRLPGEGQKVDRFVEVFQKAFWQDNSGTQYCPFRQPDTIHLISYATILLNTDLHRANADKGKRKKMTKPDFFSMLRGQDQGHDIDPEYLGRIYDNIAAQPIELAVESSEAGGAPTTGGGVTLNIGKSHLTLPISGLSNILGKEKPASAEEEKNFIREISKQLRDSEDLLRSLSTFTYYFQVTGVDTNISLDLVSFIYETVWFHFHAITDSLLSTPNNDIHVTFAALDVLCYSLTSAIFLDLKVERIAFSGQLDKFIKMCEASGGLVGEPICDNSWFTAVEIVTPQNAMETIAQVHKLIVTIKDKIQETANFELTRSVASKIEKKAKVMERNTYFVREGELSKRNRNGRLDVYYFFLFSDQLIYAKKNISGEYKVHGQLSLSSVNVSDVDDPKGCSFHIQHPTKSFVVVCVSESEKKGWLRDIQQTIQSCLKRESATGRGRKLSIIDRVEDQQMVQINESKQVLRSAYRPNNNMAGGVTSPDRETTTNAKHESRNNTPFSESSNEDIDDDDKNGNEEKESQYEINAPKTKKTPSPPKAIETVEEKILKFNNLIHELNEESLNGMFIAGCSFWTNMMDSRSANAIPDDVKLRMYGVMKQAKFGSQCNHRDADPEVASPKMNTAVTQQQNEAWIKCGDMKQSTAKIEFLNILYSYAPYWKYQQYI